MFSVCIVLDGGRRNREQDLRDLRDTGNDYSPSQQQASVRESNIDDYSVADQSGNTAGHYDRPDPSSIGVPRVYTSLSGPDRAHSSVSSSPAYELIR